MVKPSEAMCLSPGWAYGTVHGRCRWDVCGQGRGLELNGECMHCHSSRPKPDSIGEGGQGNARNWLEAGGNPPLPLSLTHPSPCNSGPIAVTATQPPPFPQCLLPPPTLSGSGPKRGDGCCRRTRLALCAYHQRSIVQEQAGHLNPLRHQAPPVVSKVQH